MNRVSQKVARNLEIGAKPSLVPRVLTKVAKVVREVSEALGQSQVKFNAVQKKGECLGPKSQVPGSFGVSKVMFNRFPEKVR